MNEAKFNMILGSIMGAIMSGVLNFSAMYMLGAPLTPRNVLFGWAGAYAIAIGVDHFFPVMATCMKITKNIKNKKAEYVIRVALFSFFEILCNSIWCLINSGFIEHWPELFPRLLLIGTIAIFTALPFVTRLAIAKSTIKEKAGSSGEAEAI